MKFTLNLIFAIFIATYAIGEACGQATAASRNLVNDFGLNVVFLSFSSHVREAASQPEISRNMKLKSAWDEAAKDALSADHLEAAMEAAFSMMFSDQEFASIYQFLESPLGHRITELEKQNQHPEMQAISVAKGKELIQLLSKERAAILSEIIKYARGLEFSTMIVMNGAKATMRGMRIVGIFPDSASDEMLQGLIDQQKRKVLIAVEEVLPAATTFTYQPLSDRELAKYLNFLKSDIGVALYEKMIPAVDRITSNAATAFENRLAAKLAKAN